ncbi:MAG TPA: bifunctional hydroxymethylpyrimidine kinase/phosphomethylpyrimidine kinase [Candidatus Saccharimonadales bacterium]|nr:bifunctional hydroxymethylpyrimidine kinase/phosphomethylpyrimidine kinase [Candidatus Saccharimonadales bacterium]
MKKTDNFKTSPLKKVLTVAGSDSGGGAGIQADLKTFAARGVYGMSAITAITAQNTVGVQAVYELPATLVDAQIRSVMDDIGADAIKIGMLANTEIIAVVAENIRKYNSPFVVLDPVMIAKSGDALLHREAIDSLIQKLIPLSFIITPNLDEAKAITKLKITTIEQMKQAAVMLHEMGAKNVVVKGGHLFHSDYSIDVLYDGKVFKEFSTKRIITKNTHGTGCTFASAIAAELAKGSDIYQAVKIAKNYVTNALEASKNLTLGKGCGSLNHIFNLKPFE